MSQDELRSALASEISDIVAGVINQYTDIYPDSGVAASILEHTETDVREMLRRYELRVVEEAM